MATTKLTRSLANEASAASAACTLLIPAARASSEPSRQSQTPSLTWAVGMVASPVTHENRRATGVSEMAGRARVSSTAHTATIHHVYRIAVIKAKV